MASLAELILLLLPIYLTLFTICKIGYIEPILYFNNQHTFLITVFIFRFIIITLYLNIPIIHRCSKVYLSLS